VEQRDGSVTWRGAFGDWEDLRATDDARERTAATLRQALVEGSLDVETTERRLAATYAAQHNRELTALVADLPQRDPSAPPTGPQRSWRGSRWLIPVALAAVAIVWAVGLEGGWHHGVWPVWPVAFVLPRILWWNRGWPGTQRGAPSRPPTQRAR
jgi:uncharacterized membrane protein YccC